MSADMSGTDPEMPPVETVEAALRKAGLIPDGVPARFRALTGGVASDIWCVEAADTVFAVKRALPKLRVAADWRAPVSRNAAEADWLRTVAGIVPDAVPRVRFHDSASGLFAMDFLPPDRFPVWKSLLRDGIVDVGFADAVGRNLAAIHARTAGDGELAARFAFDEKFHAIRLEPYLEATAAKHPAIAGRLRELSRATLAHHQALVHGDVSPKNILAGPKGPVFLDAECAWYGDPAFDLAFCLNHLLLKCVWNRGATGRFLEAFDALRHAYLGMATFESPARIDERAAALLPGLMLGRIDGKSPVEYITAERDRQRVRDVAIPLIAAPPSGLGEVLSAWREAST
jgi:5-methylthioribose kinase